MRGQIRHADCFVWNIWCCHWFVLLQVKYAWHSLWLWVSAGSLSTTCCSSFCTSSSCRTMALLSWCWWSGYQVWRVLPHVLYQVRFLGANRWIIIEKKLNVDKGVCVCVMLSIKVSAVPKCTCDCIGRRSTALHVSPYGLRDEPRGSRSPYSHGYSGGTWMACLCCVGDGETVNNG